VFQPNTSHLQHGLFSGDQLLPKKYRDRLRTSWAHSFRRDVFARIDERLCSVLYSEEHSRPNVPVNVLIGMELLKEGFGWSDRQLHNHLIYDLQVRYSLGLDDMTMQVPELRTLYNFRRRVQDYAEKNGENLYARVLAQLTEAQVERVAIKTHWQRIDSTQLLSNLAQMNRLELIISVVQVLWKHLDEADRAPWLNQIGPYVKGRPQKVCYTIRSSESQAHLQALGTLLVAWSEHAEGFGPKGAALLHRILKEQYEVLQPEKSVRIRAPKEIASGSLQSPHDAEATFRTKAGKHYRGGYVASVSETCDPHNPVQLITDVQVAPNQTDDAELLRRSLDSQAEGGIAVKQVTCDGGFTGPVAERACATHQVELRATHLRGGASKPEHLGWQQYEWRWDERGEPVSVRCPRGVEALLKDRGNKRFVAHFTKADCAGCPWLGTACRVNEHPRRNSLTLARRTIEVARARQALRPEDGPIRAAVESTVRSVKHRFPGGKLPVRGLIRATMVLCASAMMVNACRLHRYGLKLGIASVLSWVRTGLRGALRCLYAVCVDSLGNKPPYDRFRFAFDQHGLKKIP
jgi:hypothetical protein